MPLLTKEQLPDSSDITVRLLRQYLLLLAGHSLGYVEHSGNLPPTQSNLTQIYGSGMISLTGPNQK